MYLYFRSSQISHILSHLLLRDSDLSSLPFPPNVHPFLLNRFFSSECKSALIFLIRNFCPSCPSIFPLAITLYVHPFRFIMCVLFYCLSSNMALPIETWPPLQLTKAILGKISNKSNILKIYINWQKNLKRVIYEYCQGLSLSNQRFLVLPSSVLLIFPLNGVLSSQMSFFRILSWRVRKKEAGV